MGEDLDIITAGVQIISSIIRESKDPLIVMVIAGLFWLLRQARIEISDKDEMITSLHKCIDEYISNNTKTLVRLVTMLEMMMYGGNRDSHS
jgi:hypothetical protein